MRNERKHDPIAVYGLLIALAVGAVQTYDALKSSDLKLIAPDGIQLVLYKPSHDEFLSIYTNLIFFNDTTSNDSEAIKEIVATLSIGNREVRYIDGVLGVMEKSEGGPNIGKWEFIESNPSVPFVIEGGKIAERKIMFYPSKDKCPKFECNQWANWEMARNLKSVIAEQSIHLAVSAKGVSGKSYEWVCHGTLNSFSKEVLEKRHLTYVPCS